jgi:hypothetical protein
MQVSCNRLYYFCCIVVIISIFSSCSIESRIKVKNYPVDTAFVYGNKIILTGDLSKDEKKRLETDLVNYWDDSLYAQKVQKLGFFYTINNPPIYDSANRVRTTAFMTGYLKSQGYYYSQIKDTVIPSYYKDNRHPAQQRVTIVDTIFTGKRTIIDSEKFSIATQQLQSLADSSKDASFIKPGKSPFAKNLVGDELNRLVTLYRQRGFFLLTRDNLIAEADTLDQSLLNFSADPFEQAQRISEAIEHKKQNPTTVITVMQRENTDTAFQLLPDSAYFKPYRVGRIYYYPEADVRLIADSVMKDTAGMKTYKDFGHTLYYRRDFFTLKALRSMTLLYRNQLYNEDAFNKTMSNFNQLPAWSQVDYRTILRGNFVDFYFLLSPARPQNITFSVEGSRNTGDFLSTGTLIGTAFNITYNNRNFLFKRAQQLTATFSNGVEFTFDKNYPFLQTFLTSLNVAYTFPNVRVPLFKKRGDAKIDVSPSYSERNDFFRIRSVVTGLGFEWKIRRNIWQWRIPNLEFYSLDTLPLLVDAFKENPFLRTSFNTGAVVSTQASFTRTVNAKNNINITNYYRVAAELSPGPLISQEIYGFGKLEGEYRFQKKVSKASSVALRAFAGVGINFSKNPKFGNTLPFFKQFFAGGPNSMRAWGLRQLGLGSSIVSDTATFRERYGDLQLELNLEYRFNIATFSSVKIGSALFADMGNVWNVKKNPALPGAEIDISRLLNDVATGVGTGLRFDFSYFLIRLDFGVKLKDPARRINNGWLNFSKFTWRDDEYGVPINNYALQLGIGLPF